MNNTRLNVYNTNGDLISSIPLVEGSIESNPGIGNGYDINLTMSKSDIYRLGLSIVFMSRRDILQSKELLESVVKEYNNDINGYNRIVDRLKEQIVDYSKVDNECDEEDEYDDDGWEYDWL